MTSAAGSRAISGRPDALRTFKSPQRCDDGTGVEGQAQQKASVDASRLRGLGPKLSLAGLAAIAAYAVFLIWYSNGELSTAYEAAARAEGLAVARTFSDDLGTSDVRFRNQRALHERLNRLRLLHPDLRRASVYVLEGGKPVRIGSTDRDQVRGPAEEHDVEPIRTGRYHFDYAREGGEHLVELHFPVRENGRPLAALGMYFDLASEDAALAKGRRNLVLGAAVSGAFLVLLLGLLLTFVVLRPLAQLRSVTHRVATGDLRARLHWRRRDQLGTLAQDFDEMAEGLEQTYGRLEQLALEDSLTGLANHRAFRDRLHAELERARREVYDVAIVAIDIDCFKQVNDTWGHAVGDEALRMIAQAIRAEVRPSDICGRIGGDEFVLALPRTDAHGAETLVARLDEAVSVLRCGPEATRLSISAGIAEFPRHASDRTEILRLADAALYRAKREGRGRHAVHSRDEQAPPFAQEEAAAC